MTIYNGNVLKVCVVENDLVSNDWDEIEGCLEFIAIKYGKRIYKKEKVISNKNMLVNIPKKELCRQISDEEFNDNNKPRELLQKISSEVIKKDLGMTSFFVDRMIEDLKIYSYFFDCIIVTDVRFKEEIECVKKNFKNVISIGVIRENFVSDLTSEQQNDITETSLDAYHEYDYKIISNSDNQEDLVIKTSELLGNIRERR